MPYRNVAVEIILDTRDLIKLCEPIESELTRVGMSSKHLCEYAISTWYAFDSPWAYYQFDGSPLKHLMVNAEMDFLNNEAFQRLGPEQQSNIRLIMMGILSNIYALVDDIVSRLNLNEYQLSTLVAKRWLAGNALVMEINA